MDNNHKLGFLENNCAHIGVAESFASQENASKGLRRESGQKIALLGI